MIAELNDTLFNSVLPINELKVKQKRHSDDVMAEYLQGEIILYSNWMIEPFDFMHTLAHELIHYYQDCLDIPINHGGKFFRYYADKYCNISGYNMRINSH